MLDETQLLNLSRRLVKCPNFRWMSGMVTTDGELVWIEGTNPFINSVITIKGHKTVLRDSKELLPNLLHPATQGCVLYLVKAAWDGRYIVYGEDQLDIEILVSALELAQEVFNNQDS